MSNEGAWGSSRHHERIVVALSAEVRKRSRRVCYACPKTSGRHRKLATHVGQCNGVTLTMGCEWHVRLWARSKRGGR